MRSPLRPGRLLAATLGGLLAGVAVWPAGASAHGISGKADLPIPAWMFAWAAVIVLIVSFTALSALWTKPRLQEPVLRRWFTLPRWLLLPCGLVGVVLFGAVVYSGLAGAQVPTANLAPTFIYVVFWVGFPVASVIFGDVFSAFSPWRAVGRAGGWALGRLRPGRRAPLSYPRWLGYWPAVIVLVGFAWLELVYVNRDDPSTLAWISIGYFVVQLAGMATFGVERWSERADGFGVYFGLLSRLAGLYARDGVVHRRRFLSGVPGLQIRPGVIALLCVVIGTTTFDGASNGDLWRSVQPHIVDFFDRFGLGLQFANEATGSVGLLFCVGLIGGFYWLGIRGMRSVGDRYETRDLARRFIHTLTPIAFAYVLAHYFSLLVFQGQLAIYLISDPLGNGSDIFGTAGIEINYSLLSSSAIWYVQVAALIIGHVCGLILAHDRALAMYGDTRQAVRSQQWMLLVMVGFTSLGLWLLSAIST